MIASQAPWEYVREAVAAADSTGLLTTTNSNWDARSTTRGRAIPAGSQAILLAFIGDHAANPEDNTATVKVTMYRSGGPAQTVQSFDLVIGGQKVNVKPRRSAANTTAKWCETIVPNATDPTSYWIATPQIIGVLADNAACIAIKTYGAAWVTIEITALGAGLSLDVLMSALDRMP